MSFVQKVGPSFLKVNNEYGESEDIVNDNFEFKVPVSNSYLRTVSINLPSYRIPRDLSPSFYPESFQNRIVGTNKVDFTITNTDIAPGTHTFSFTWPTRNFIYFSSNIKSIDYISILQKLLNDEINKNPIFKDKTQLFVILNSDQRTIIASSVTDTTLPANSVTTFSFLFGTGVNKNSSAFFQMGFDQADVSSSNSIIYTFNPLQLIVSPKPTNLRIFNYIDVDVKESDVTPMKRIFNVDSRYNSLFFQRDLRGSHFEVGRTDHEKIEDLHVRLSFPGGQSPTDYTEAQTNGSETTVGLGFSLIQLAEDEPRKIKNFPQSFIF